ncbi:uncharacterized protein LOC122341374 [Puntigrus tetrazona]|uniref:uncharacterized protein LOC122341374 n=1 Tax=Puntigrus tetrazona TaxID=1606681 RepID=UPI001C8915CE|nr:uncharacterized protein LOC122341374 [Puntigrus tetrazona]
MEKKQPEKSRPDVGMLRPYRPGLPSQGHRDELPQLNTVPSLISRPGTNRQQKDNHPSVSKIIHPRGHHRNKMTTLPCIFSNLSYAEDPVGTRLLGQEGNKSLFLKQSVLRMLPVPPSAMEEQLHEIQHETDFHPGSYCPKVQMPYVCPPGHVPRKIEIESMETLLCMKCFWATELQRKPIELVFTHMLQTPFTQKRFHSDSAMKQC